ncbi:MAG TPA: zinc ribbon domain-containing protein [Pyrinomonadaceae bacterium]|nr:zinc ribbon domain-containing protein [Pyrinomonadaceae bacterium]
MHCPVCGQQQISEDTRFCSRCGFLLTGVAEIVANGGVIPGAFSAKGNNSPRKRGAMQGLFVLLLSLLIVPLVVLFSVGLRLGPGLTVFTAILLGAGGLLRIAYAFMFESNEGAGMTLEEKLVSQIRKPSDAPALPAHQAPTASEFVSPGSAWRDTNDLAIPHSVTDSTTKLLEKEQDN